PPTPTHTLFPYTTLFRSEWKEQKRRWHEIGEENPDPKTPRSGEAHARQRICRGHADEDSDEHDGAADLGGVLDPRREVRPLEEVDRKSTRLNSSHVAISY